MNKSEMVVSKTFSARFLMTTSLTLTACIGFLQGKVPAEAFMGVLSSVVTFYFLRSDRKDEPTKDKPSA